MKSDWAIRADGVGKEFMLGEREQYLALRDVISSAGSRLLWRARRDAGETRSSWALEELTFEIAPGEVVGLVGRNGAGKSTLLKLISSITRPTVGTVSVKGRIGTLLEVGSGFHPELTGSENVYLNGAILGMRRAEIDRNFDDIVEFSGVGEYLDTPVKRYSTGMFMRLAFAVAAYLDTEVLLVDEILAVGDAEFQRKCIGRMGELSQNQGRTVVFVSHSDAAIRQLCPRSIWIHDGRVRMDDRSDVVLPAYLNEQFEQTQLGSWIDVPTRARRGSGEARFSQIRLEVPDHGDARTATTGAPLRVRVRIEASEPVACGSISFDLSTLGGVKLVVAGVMPPSAPVDLSRGTTELVIEIDALNINPGRYSASLWMSRPTGSDQSYAAVDHVERAIDVVVTSDDRADPPDWVVSSTSSVRVEPSKVRR